MSREIQVSERVGVSVRVEASVKPKVRIHPLMNAHRSLTELTRPALPYGSCSSPASSCKAASNRQINNADKDKGDWNDRFWLMSRRQPVIANQRWFQPANC
uniref:Uncharacterized protein n=1 Tax=Schistocephalus solidus TaxID=70667 RepID=A0A0X3PGY7_SCHSO